MSGILWHGYLAVERFADNLNEDNWVLLIDAIRSIETQPNGHAEWMLQERGNFDHFEYIADDPETPEDETVLYSNIVIWEARYLASEIQFENFRTELVALFDVADDKVTFTTGTTIIREQLSCFATFFYNDKRRIRVGLFGCASDSELCTWEESRVECDGFIQDSSEDWNGVAE